MVCIWFVCGNFDVFRYFTCIILRKDPLQVLLVGRQLTQETVLAAWERPVPQEPGSWASLSVIYPTYSYISG